MKYFARYIIPFLIAASVCSCREKANIPKSTMSKIYYDIYMTDEALKDDFNLRKKADSLMVYAPVFRKYGYTVEDYQQSVDIYLQRPDKFLKIFEDTRKMLERRMSALKKEAETEGKWSGHWDIVDSLELFTMDGVRTSPMYRYLRVMFFRPDSSTANFPAADSTMSRQPSNAFFLFSDSAYSSDYGFEFYLTKGIPDEIRKLQERDSCILLPEKQERDVATMPKKYTIAPKLEITESTKVLRNDISEEI